jgi:hypothetical protein
MNELFAKAQSGALANLRESCLYIDRVGADLRVPAENCTLRIPLKSAADSERSRPPVPIEAGRGFR